MRVGRPGVRLGIVAAASVCALAGCSSSGGSTAVHSVSGAFGSLPAASSTVKSGGAVTFGMLPGNTPTYIMPVVPAVQSTNANLDFEYLMWPPLYFPTDGYKPEVDPQQSLASAPTFSDGDKTVTIHMSTAYKWSNGKPVDANDVIFSIDIVKAAIKESTANWGNFAAGQFPQNVTSASALNSSTVVLKLNQAYNPAWFALDQLPFIVPMPSTSWDIDRAGGPALNYNEPTNAQKIYNFLNAQSLQTSTYMTNPLWQVVDGPFRLAAFSPSTGANTLVPNKAYTGPDKPHISQFQQVAFTSEDAEFAALRSGELTVGQIPPQDLPQATSLEKLGYNVFGYPGWGYSQIFFNYLDATGSFDKIISNLYVRQALAHLIDQPAYVKGIFNGAAVAQYAQVYPGSPYTPSAASPPYPYSVSAAENLLKANGWKVTAGGTDTCARAGSAKGECGAGIPEGAPLAFNMLYDSGLGSGQAEAIAFASSARQAGIQISLEGKGINDLINNYYNAIAPQNENKWAAQSFGGGTTTLALYPTTNTELATTGIYNEGSYNDPTLDKLIHDSIYSSNPAAVKAEASYLAKNVPVMFLPNPMLVFAWKDTLSGSPASFGALTQQFLAPESWYFTN